MKLIEDITKILQDAIKEIYQIEKINIVVQYTNKGQQGDITIILFPLLKLKLGSSNEIGNKIGAYISEKLGYIHEYDVINGYLNIKIADFYWVNLVQEMYLTLKQ